MYKTVAAEPSVLQGTTSLSSNGAWCWFGDPRAIEDEHSLYSTWITNGGDIVVNKNDFHDGKSYQAKMPIKLSINDHNNPSLLYLKDGNLMVFYSGHNGSKMYYQKTALAGDINSFSEPQFLKANTGKGFTYPNPLTVDFFGRERIMLFWRDFQWQPRFTYSDDQGLTWSKSIQLVENYGQRPYVKYFKGDSGKVHIAMTDGHPANNIKNSIYYMYMKDSVFYRANGEKIGDMLDLPFSLRKLDKIYDPVKLARPRILAGEEVIYKRAWIWSIAEDRFSNGVVAYSITDKNFNHDYLYSTYRGKWINRFITNGGGTIQLPNRHKREHYYAGGVFIDSQEPNKVYLSKKIGTAKHQIEKWKMNRRGRFKRMTKYTSSAASFRPFVPYLVNSKQKRKTAVLWMSGTYDYYTDFQTKIIGLFNN